jgi:hypothetical protein
VVDVANVPVTVQPWPGNEVGGTLTIAKMAQFIRDDGDSPAIKSMAGNILRQAGFPKSARDRAQALLDYVRKAVGYVEDQPMREWVQSARITLCVDGAPVCIPIEDCDGMAVALGALLRAAGIDVKIQSIDYGPGVQPHVNLVFKDDSGHWLEIDATTNRPIGSGSPGKKVLVDPLDPKAVPSSTPDGAFIGVGRPHDPVVAMFNAYDHRLAELGFLSHAGDRSIGAGLVTPGDVLSYRVAWNQYVTDTVRVGLECGAAYAGLAQQKQQSDPQTAQVLAGIGKQITDASNELLADWNVWANTQDSTIVLQGAAILEQQQQVVLEAGRVRDMVTQGTLTCQPTYVNQAGVVTTWIAGVDPSIQAQIIARIEGLGILSQGILQVLTESAGNALVEAGDASKYLAGGLKWTISPWTWAAIGLGVAGIAGLLIYNADKVSKLAQSLTPLHAGEPMMWRARKGRARCMTRASRRRAAARKAARTRKARQQGLIP